MTREGQGEGPEDVERPLASTRWSGPGATPDDDLLPPFVPGRTREPPDEAAPGPVDSAPAPEPHAESDWSGHDAELAEPATEGDVKNHEEAVADTGESVVGGDEAVAEEEVWPFESPGAWDEPFQFETDATDGGIDDFGLPGEGLPDTSGFDDAAPADTPSEDVWSTEAWVPEETETDDPAAEPWSTEEPGAEPWAAVAPSLDEPGTDETSADDADDADDGQDGGEAAELAMRLEDLAARIRSEGADGARAGMASSDRLTALLSSLIAGYLEGREG
jgi:hypothetical protein